jgi:2,4-dienoyl-CoA reductase-like NADH-dependent reductase (Old Yellow Enzyme family)
MLNQNLKLPCGVTIKNRIAKAALSENMAFKSHCPGKEFETLYSLWANGGAGLVITGNVMIDSSALGEPYNVVIEKNHTCLEELKNWAQQGSKNNTHIWMQLNHPGKQSPKYLSEKPVAPSAIAYSSALKNMFNPPKELTEVEILNLIDRFAFAAKTAKRAGFTGVQIHAAHGYLVNQFLSPLHNQRSDKWGGSLNNRMNFVIGVYQKIRQEVGVDFPIGIKLNSADFQKGGFTEEESMEVVQKLASLGIDLFEISGGTYEAPKMMESQKQSSSTKIREAFFLDYCEKIRQKIQTPILLTGGFRTQAGINQALTSKATDMIGLGRTLALNPSFANQLLQNEKITSQVKPLSSGFTSIDKLIPLEIVWYTEQLHRMGKGKMPKENLSVMLTIIKTTLSLGTSLLKKNRAK